jgi:hypothetical protein
MEEWKDGAIERRITQYSNIPTFQYSKIATYYTEEPYLNVEYATNKNR